jgi:hypothetical protein
MTKESATKESFVNGDSGRHAPLAMESATFRKLGHRLVDQLGEFLELLPLGPVTRDESPSVVRDALDLTGPLPEKGMDPGPLLEKTAQLLFAHGPKKASRPASHRESQHSRMTRPMRHCPNNTIAAST